MAVAKIEEYRQRDGTDILKVCLRPTKKFPVRYFYAPLEAVDLVQSYTWHLYHTGKGVRVSAVYQGSIYFHKELFKLYHGFDWKDDINHINMIGFDNVDENLNIATRQQSCFNSFVRGYIYYKQHKSFCCQVNMNGHIYHPCSVTHREDEVCIQQNYLEQVLLKEKLGDNWYMFDFLKYRRGSEDILDLERTGQISEEAVYKHILRYCENAWYMLRYDLKQYFIDNHIPIPQYRLDIEGFMIHPITGQRLCILA